ncbi:MAG: hypothetical protein IPK83_23875 [Planctomycetes bacterium]|nr:hypothetical protein [Planctomycetota bacterium]
MYQINPEKYEKLRNAILDHDYLHRIQRRIEQLNRVVFHDQISDWKHLRALAEEILIADLVTRHKGEIDGVFFKLREIENSGRDWKSAIDEYASYIHNYYTTPLGALLRKDVLGAFREEVKEEESQGKEKSHRGSNSIQAPPVASAPRSTPQPPRMHS